MMISSSSYPLRLRWLLLPCWCLISMGDYFQCQAFLLLTTKPIATSPFLSSPIANSFFNEHCKRDTNNSCTRRQAQFEQTGDILIQNGDSKEKDDIYSQYYRLLKSLLEKISIAGTDGTKIPEEQSESILDIVQQLENLQKNNEVNLLPVEGEKNYLSFNSNKMTEIPLVGEHLLLYSDTPRTTQYIGPFKGKTTQNFIDATIFQNILELGPFLKINLTADRQIMDGKRIKLFFRKFVVSLFGMEVVQKELDAKGVWKMVFVGELEMENCHSSIESKKFLLRVMRTPNLYILVQEL